MDNFKDASLSALLLSVNLTLFCGKEGSFISLVSGHYLEYLLFQIFLFDAHHETGIQSDFSKKKKRYRNNVLTDI